jgi:hypothetical protein
MISSISVTVICAKITICLQETNDSDKKFILAPFPQQNGSGVKAAGILVARTADIQPGVEYDRFKRRFRIFDPLQ